MLDVKHADPDLLALETDTPQDARYDKGIGKRFRFTMQIVRTVESKGKLHQFGGLRLEKLKNAETEWSMRLNDRWRLIVEFEGEPPKELIRILRISDHYDD